MKSNERNIGLILEALALVILVVVALQMNTPDKNLGLIGILVITAILLFIPGIILVVISHLPKQKEKQQNA
jgi:hypothetical protein